MTVAEASKQASMLPLLVHNVAGRMLDPLVVIVVRSSRCTKEESVLQQIVQFVHERIMFFQLRTASVDYRYLRRHRKNMRRDRGVDCVCISMQRCINVRAVGAFVVPRAVHDKPMCVSGVDSQ